MTISVNAIIDLREDEQFDIVRPGKPRCRCIRVGFSTTLDGPRNPSESDVLFCQAITESRRYRADGTVGQASGYVPFDLEIPKELKERARGLMVAQAHQLISSLLKK